MNEGNRLLLERRPVSIGGDAIDVLTIDCSLTGAAEGFDALDADFTYFSCN